MGDLQTKTTRAFEVFTYLQKFEKNFARLLSSDVNAARRFVQVAIDATVDNPDILDPNKHTRQSLMGAILECATLRLEPGVLGQCWILPFKSSKHGGATIATFIAGYRGLVQLALRSPKVSQIWGGIIHEGDEWDWQDYPPKLHHRAEPGGDPDRDYVAVYSVMKNEYGHEQITFMWKSLVEKRRNLSRAKYSGPWKTWTDEMRIKTVLKYGTKTYPVSIEERALHRAVDLDNRADAGLDQRLGRNVALLEQPEGEAPVEDHGVDFEPPPIGSIEGGETHGET